MPIWKIDGKDYLDSGTVIVDGDAVVEVDFQVGKDPNKKHQVALKFRSDDGPVEMRVGTAKPGRTVVHFANFPFDSVSSNGGVSIGEIDGKGLWLAFIVEPFKVAPPGNVRRLTYTFYLAPKRP